MRRVRYHAHGGPDVLSIEEADVPSPGPGQVLIRAEAIGVNYVDVQLRRATDPGSLYYRELPATLTGDVVGTICALGPGADPALADTRVAVLLEDAYADYVLAGTDWLVPAPPELPAAVASMLPTVGAVALGALRAGRLAKGETVLVTSGAGGIGHLAVQLAKLLGAGTVVATASSPDKLAAAAGLGADVTVSHAGPGWAEEVRGELTSVPVRAMFGLKTMTGFSLLGWRAAAAAQARADIAELTSLLGSGELRVMTRTLPLSEAVQAHRLLESRAVAGRLILAP
jgi:NADPH:quinone reductase